MNDLPPKEPSKLDKTEIPVADLQRHLRDMFGEGTRLTGVTRLDGGIGKKTYLLDCDSPGSRCILHVFVVPETGLTEITTPHDAVFFPTCAEAFAANTELLIAQGVSVPRIYVVDRSQTEYDFALVEYIDGNTMAELLDKGDAQVFRSALEGARNGMLKMHSLTRSHPGSAVTDSAPPVSCEDVVFEHSLQGLGLASEYNSELRGNRGRIRKALENLRAEIEPRSSYHFIHGELGPEHIMIDRAGRVYFIDIEVAAFFDLEYEHSYVRWRFGVDYAWFARDDLDDARMYFYLLARLISVNATTSEGAAKSSDETEWGRFCRDVSAGTTRRILEHLAVTR